MKWVKSGCGQTKESTENFCLGNAHRLMSAIFWTFAEHHLEFDTENDSEPITMALSMKTVFRNNAKTKQENPKHRSLEKKAWSKPYLLGTENFRPCLWNPAHVGSDFSEHEG